MSTLLLAQLISLPCFGASARASAMPVGQMGAALEKQYQGEGLSVHLTADGALLRCVFQGLEGEVTRDGLWLKSTTGESNGKRFRVLARAVRRVPAEGLGSVDFAGTTDWRFERLAGLETEALPEEMLADFGQVEVTGNAACFIREQFTEEYRVSVEGVRQDFIVARRSAGQGQVRVDLDVEGAKVEPLANGVRLVLEGSGRKLNYSRLRVTDAAGRELAARMELGTAQTLAVLVDDRDAIYPLRIDPTFSDADWFSFGGTPGPDSAVLVSAVDASGNLYIGGFFTTIGDVVASHIAKWNGNVWSALGSGMDSVVSTLAVSGNDLYAGGDFTTAGGISANHIAKWNGSAWSTLGSGMDASVEALAVSGGTLYAGGVFTQAGPVSANYIAKWNGTAWSALGSGVDNEVYALAVSGSILYVGGYFSTAGAVTANYIAKWNGSAWSALGSGMDDQVNVLTVSGGNLYAGGAFFNAGGKVVNHIAKWNGSAWSALGSGMSGDGFFEGVNGLVLSGNDLYAAGNFTNAGGISANGIAKWNGSAWSPLGSGLTSDMNNASVYALSVFDGNVYVGGGFNHAGEVIANSFAKWNGTVWSALGSGTGLNAPVYALAISGSDLYVGGDFTMVGGAPANRIAKWNPASGWSALGSGMDSTVRTLAVSGSDLYAGGYFTNAGGISANYVARWNGTTWSGLGSGMDSSVGALAVSGGDLFVGGSFTSADGTSANYIAKWNGSAWSALGLGMSDSVYALAISGADLYASGSFTNAGGIAANHIAKWNGSVWSRLGLGTDDLVWALAVSGNDLYAGGFFTTAGGISMNHIAKWNSVTGWSALGSGADDFVNALVVSGSDLFVGGDFVTADGTSANHIAKWNPETGWSALGSGVNSFVNALAVWGSDLFAGGYFATAGGKTSTYAARANIGGVVLPILSISRSGSDLTLSWPSAGSAGFVLEQTLAVASPGWTTNPNSVTDDATNKSTTLHITNSAQFFRLRKQ